MSFVCAATPTYENGLFVADLREEGDTEALNIGFDTIFTPNYLTYTATNNNEEEEVVEQVENPAADEDKNKDVVVVSNNPWALCFIFGKFAICKQLFYHKCLCFLESGIWLDQSPVVSSGKSAAQNLNRADKALQLSHPLPAAGCSKL